MTVHGGSFETSPSHNFTGIGKNLEKDSSIHNFTLSGAYTWNTGLHVGYVENQTSEMSKTLENHSFPYSVGNSIDFNYRIMNKYPVEIAYTYLRKETKRVTGFSIGAKPFPFFRFIFGLNQENYEMGSFASLGYGWNSASYVYDSYHSDDFNSTVNDSSEYTERSSMEHFFADLGFYASYFIYPFAFTYSPSFYQPWLKDELPVNDDNEEYDIFFDFPLIINQYVGVSVWIFDSFKYSLGVSFVTDCEFKDLAFAVNSSFGFWFR